LLNKSQNNNDILPKLENNIKEKLSKKNIVYEDSDLLIINKSP
jgi:23S rRNA-/tRNA-specific pseudouridylate synthase